VINRIQGDLEKILQSAGIYYRIFARQKSELSIKRKLELKSQNYYEEGKRMQDIIGIRIVFYFLDDVQILNDYLHRKDSYIDDSDSRADVLKAQELVDSIKNLSDKVFMPTRLNLVFRMDEICSDELNRELEQIDSSEFDKNLIDNTYEVQLRTVLSEGWHEIEHDLRYKTLNESWWEKCEDESRMLNGIYATLETSERAMHQIFSTIAYKNYKFGDWSAMLRNHLRIHTLDDMISTNLKSVLDSDKDLVKKLFRISRKDVINRLLSFDSPFPLKLDNLIFLMNRMNINDQKIREEEPSIIKDLLNRVFPS